MSAKMTLVGFKSLVWAGLSFPLFALMVSVFQDLEQPGSALGADPGETVVLYLGEWSLIMLLIAFSVSPMRRLLTAQNVALSQYPMISSVKLGQLFARSRRLFGLFAFTYACLHLLAYVAFFLEFSWASLWQDIVKRPYVTVGMASVLILFMLAFTSTKGWQRRLGRRWTQIHRLVYVALGLGIVHFWWLTKDGYAEVALFAVWYVVLILLRLRGFTARRHSRAEIG